MTSNYLLCGVGGQGTVLAARVLAQAAINAGHEVKTTETIGMAQRGGSVVSHVRVGEDIASPLLPLHAADLILGFEPAEVVRNIQYLKPDGVVAVSRKAVKPVTAALTGSGYDGREMIAYLEKKVSNLIIVDTEEICRQCGSDRVVNVALLGAAVASGRLPVTEEEMRKALLMRIPDKFSQLNLQAFALGLQCR